jgi:hypothetical protein
LKQIYPLETVIRRLLSLQSKLSRTFITMNADNKILYSVRDELLSEAQKSPGLLSDLANLERYVAESYSARSFIELLQNADDAGAKRFVVIQDGDRLICANDGRAFTRNDFYSLCRSASSDKKRGQSIGYRGIGFKSVVGMVSEVHLLSETLTATFSRQLTHESLGVDVPTPLVRIPHPLALVIDAGLEKTIAEIQSAGFSTLFIFCGIDRSKVEEEFALFDAEYLLFLRNITEAKLIGTKAHTYLCSREALHDHCRRIEIVSDDRRSAWQVHSYGKCDIAFSLADGKPVPLNSSSALVHAFLPTLEQTGLGVRINADFSTDPSRTRIVFDDFTGECVTSAADAVATLLRDALQKMPMDSDVAMCLVPTFDLATLPFQKRTFRTEFVARVRERLSDLKDDFLVPPQWLNSNDSAIAANAAGKAMIVSESRENGLLVFLRYLGVQPLSFDTVLEATKHQTFSEKGCTETAAFAVRNANVGANAKNAAATAIWMGVDGSAKSLKALAQNGAALSDGFIRQLNSAGVSNNDLLQFVCNAVGDAANRVLPNMAIADTSIEVQQPLVITSTPAIPSLNQMAAFDPLLPGSTNVSQSPYMQQPELETKFLPAWRGAEQYVAQILQSHGYEVEDRSRQNLGYDIYAAKENRKYYLEVKLLDYTGQPFVITPNEEAVARECKERYALALVLRGKEGVHIQFIHDPVARLKFVRQCRQWVWECSEYEFVPHMFGG